MAYDAIDALLHWLQLYQYPMLVQLPQAQYDSLRAAWILP